MQAQQPTSHRSVVAVPPGVAKQSNMTDLLTDLPPVALAMARERPAPRPSTHTLASKETKPHTHGGSQVGLGRSGASGGGVAQEVGAHGLRLGLGLAVAHRSCL